MVLKARLGATPVAMLRTNNATLRLQPFVEVLVPASNSAFQSLFSLDVVSAVGWLGLAGVGWGWLGLAGSVGGSQGLASSYTLLICSALAILVSFLFLQYARTFLPQDLCTCCTLCLGHFFLWLSAWLAWLASPHLSGLSLNVAAFLRAAFWDHPEKHGPLWPSPPTALPSWHLPLSERVLSGYFGYCSPPLLGCVGFPRAGTQSVLFTLCSQCSVQAWHTGVLHKYLNVWARG